MRWLILLCGLLISNLAFATDARDDLTRFLKDTRTVRLNFVQVTLGKSDLSAQQTEGTLWIARPGRFRWETQKPYPQLIVGNDEQVWFYDPDLNQVIVRNRAEALGGTPAALLAGNTEVENAFTLAVLPDFQGMRWLQAIPKSGDSGFQEIRMGFKDGKLAMLELTDAFAQKIVTHFTLVNENPKLDAKLFDFTVPQGADVIR